jgi:transposase
LSCPHCHSKEVWRRGKRQRRVHTLPIGPKPVVLVVEVPKCECRTCAKSFEVSPPLPQPIATTPVPWLDSSAS